MDPDNPGTHGRLSGFTVYSEVKQAVLGWDFINLKGLNAFYIYRRENGDSSFVRIAQVPPSVFSFKDNDVNYNVEYEYYITAKAGDYESPPSAIKRTTPGPTYTWVADFSTGFISCLTHDTRFILGSFGILNFPYLVAPSPRENSAWVYSRYSDGLYKIDHGGNRILALSGFKNIIFMQADTIHNDLWIARDGPGKVDRLNLQGELEISVSSIKKPTRLTVDATRHMCWVVDDSSREIVLLSYGGSERIRRGAGLNAPMDIALAQKQELIWIADSSRIVQLDYNAEPTGVEIDGFSYVWLIDYDNVRNICWAADLAPYGYNSHVLKISDQGEILAKLDSFLYPRCLDVNEFDGSCLIGDIGNGQLWKISADGNSVNTVGDFAAPYDVSVEHHGHFAGDDL
ncbi:hypothetical protein JW935_05455 [candidate division KSB1 bacterium]|nr:hypothetical protein [candidate division KSB1 bacterium]